MVPRSYGFRHFRPESTMDNVKFYIKPASIMGIMDFSGGEECGTLTGSKGFSNSSRHRPQALNIRPGFRVELDVESIGIGNRLCRHPDSS